jgi:hypothetical protein
MLALDSFPIIRDREEMTVVRVTTTTTTTVLFVPGPGNTLLFYPPVLSSSF